MKKNPPQSVKDFIDLLDVPEVEIERLHAVIPDDLKAGDFYSGKKNSLLLSISKWVRKTLIARPGFLYDRMWAATLMGIKEESFAKVEAIFAEAKYAGIFADEGNERWWQSKIREILFSRFPENESVYPWELGRLLPGLKESDFSGCRPGVDCPDTVAFTDEKADKDSRIQIPLRDTVPHPNFEKSLFFEEIRMMKGKE